MFRPSRSTDHHDVRRRDRGRWLRRHVHAARCGPRVLARVFDAATASAAPGTGTAIPGPAATSRASTTRSPSTRTSSRSGPGASGTRTQPEILSTPTTSPTASTSARTSSSRRASTRPCGTTRPPLDDRHVEGRDHLGAVLRDGVGCLSTPKLPEIPGVDELPGPDVPHRSLAARGRRLHRPERRHHRHRLVGHPVDPDHRRSRPPTSPCSSARRTSACPPATARSARRGTSHEGDLPGAPRAARTSGFGVPVEEPTRSALEVCQEERDATSTRSAGSRGTSSACCSPSTT